MESRNNAQRSRNTQKMARQQSRNAQKLERQRSRNAQKQARQKSRNAKKQQSIDKKRARQQSRNDRQLKARSSRNDRQLKARSSRKPVRGGAAVGAGAYGCVFRPALHCAGEPSRRRDAVTKLGRTADIEQEKNTIDAVRAILSEVPRYEHYFVLDDAAVCEPAPLQESDLQNAGICHTFKGMEINDNLAGLRALTMPDGGMDLLDYCNELTVDEQAFKSINTLLLDLVENGIVPMSTAGIIHGDIKFENLVIDPQRKTSIRLIDWGNAKVSVPTMLRHTVTPLVFNRPPGSVFLHADINDRLATLSEQLGEEATIMESLANALRESVGEHRDSANIDIIIRFVYGSDVTDIRTDRTTMQNTHLASILRKYYNGSVFEQQRFITETYIHNCDLYGFAVMYALMIAAMTQFEFENDTFDRTARRLVKDFVLSATYASDRMDSQKLLDAMHTLGACVDPRKRARLE